MPDAADWFEESDDAFYSDSDDLYSDGDAPDDDFSDTWPCPSCGSDIYEDSVRCPVCGDFVTPGGSIWSGRPVWWIILGLLGTVAVILTLVLSFPG